MRLIFEIQLVKVASKILSQKPMESSKAIGTEQGELSMQKKRSYKSVKSIEQKIETQIERGNLSIQQRAKEIGKRKYNGRQSYTKQRQIRLKLNNSNYDMEQLHRQVILQKEQQREKEKNKRKEAVMMIERLKKQKEVHHNKIKTNEMNIKIKNSQISQQIMQVIKRHRERLLQQKKRHMKLRIEKNINRKIQREEDQVKNQLKYWNKIKEFEKRKHSHSTKILPSICQTTEMQEQDINFTKLEKDNQSCSRIPYKRTISKQQVVPLQQNVDKQIETDKLLHEDVEFSMSFEHSNYERQNRKKSFEGQSSKMLEYKSSHKYHKYQRANNYQNSRIIELSNQLQLAKKRSNGLIEQRNKIIQNLLNIKNDKKLSGEYRCPIEMISDKGNPENLSRKFKHRLQLLQKCQSQPLESGNSSQLVVKINKQYQVDMEEKLECQLYKNQFLS